LNAEVGGWATSLGNGAGGAPGWADGGAYGETDGQG
jgi:hypothetical protein